MTSVGPGAGEPSYPIGLDLQSQVANRNRLTTGFRLVLGVPQLIIVGGFSAIGFEYGGLRDAGALAAAAFTMAFISWFAIVFTGKQPRGLWDFAAFYLRWWVRVSAYMALLRDEYPPFGEGAYPTTCEITYPDRDRDRWSVGLRFLYVIPQVFVLIFVNIGWFVTTVIAWFAILFTGSYPEGLYRFGVGALRWNLRVQSYVLLLRDEYPPFHLTP
jgi:Domain of unknown function (DUF4389)